MTIQEYIDAVASRLDLPERVVGRIRKDLENELFELVQAGRITRETALQHAIHQEALAIRLG